jgi:hypothetical protein
MKRPRLPSGPEPFGIPAGTVAVTQVALRLTVGAPRFDELARQGDPGLADLVGYVDGLSVLIDNAVPVP